MKPAAQKKPRFVRVLSLTVLAVAVFLTSLWLLFPYGEVEKRVNQEFRNRGIDAEITGLGPRTPFTYRIKSIRLPRIPGKERELKLTDALVHVKPSMLLDGKFGLTVTGEIFGGTVRADLVAPRPESVDLEWENVDLALIVPLISEKEFPLTGRTGGSGIITLPYEGLQRIDAEVDATVTDLTVGQVNAMGFALGPIALGSGRVKAEAQKGRVRVSEASLAGGDIGLAADGAVTLAAPLARSPIEGTARVKPTPKAEGEYFIAFSMLSQFKQADGSYLLKVSGTPSAPLVR